MKKASIVFSLLLLAAVFAAGQDVVSVHLKDGSVIKGTITSQNDQAVTVKSDYGEMRISRDKIDRIEKNTVEVSMKDGSTFQGTIEKETNAAITLVTSIGTITLRKSDIKEVITNNKKSAQESSDAATSEEMGKAFLYAQRKKSVGVALALQTVGAGLVYSEAYSIGIPLLLAQNGLFIAAPLVGDSNTATGLLVAGGILTAVDTLLTIASVNSYNRYLSDQMGMTALETGASLAGNSIELSTNASYCGDDHNDVPLGATLAWMFPEVNRFSWGIRLGGGYAVHSGFGSGAGLADMALRFVYGHRLDGFAGFVQIGYVSYGFSWSSWAGNEFNAEDLSSLTDEVGVYYKGFFLGFSPYYHAIPMPSLLAQSDAYKGTYKWNLNIEIGYSSIIK